MRLKKIILIILLLSSTSCTLFERTKVQVEKLLDPSYDKDFIESSNYFILKEGKIKYFNLPSCIPNKYQYEIGIVQKVIDGDSIIVSIKGYEKEVRYIGIDAPEFQPETKIIAQKAMDENKKLVFGEIVLLFKDKSDTDKYGRLLRYVFTSEYFINLELTLRGVADIKTYPPDIACNYLFIQENQK